MPNERLMPKFLTREIAGKAINSVLGAVMPSGMPSRFPLKRHHCHVVVLVPSMEDDRAGDYPKWPNYHLEPVVLFEQSVGPSEEWEHPFDDIARCKALQLWHGRNDDRTDSMPHLLFPGDTPFWGGVKRNGIVVACSGIQPWFDKMISGMVADVCIALSYEAWMQSEDRAKGLNFLLS